MERCQVSEKWCGVGKYPEKDPTKFQYYTSRGTPYECLKKGIGAGKAMAEKIDSSSVRNLKYIGEVYEKRMSTRGIKSLRDLYEKCLEPNFGNILRRSLVRNKVLDKRAWNSVLWHLFSLGYKPNLVCEENA